VVVSSLMVVIAGVTEVGESTKPPWFIESTSNR
jgi:hypothetical protein